jgi:predicted glycogen debranching enzyme
MKPNILPRIYMGREVTSSPESRNYEWLISNGLGGYASSTILGSNTRKYHGLLIAALYPPVDRWNLLTKLDEEIFTEDSRFVLGTNYIDRGEMDVHGYEQPCSFALDPLPRFEYSFDGMKIVKRVAMKHGENLCIICYEVINPTEYSLQLRISPLLAFRTIYSTNDLDASSIQIGQRSEDGVLILSRRECRAMLALTTNLLEYKAIESRFKRLFYPMDFYRGESCYDDNMIPGHFTTTIEPGEKARLYVEAKAMTDNETIHFDVDAWKVMRSEVDRLRRIIHGFGDAHRDLTLYEWMKWVILAADSFVVDRRSTGAKSIVAGYHWFRDWGRDSMISLPGLTLVTGRFHGARDVMLTFVRYCRGGIIPNYFPDDQREEPLYNTVDATLWLFNAVLQYLKYTGDLGFIRSCLWEALKSIIDFHVEGTINGTKMDGDGLLIHGPQLTWMDAKKGERFITPRDGKAVEVQALWYNVLKVAQLLAKHLNESSLERRYREMASHTKENFPRLFWNDGDGCLFDCVNGGVKDRSMRPNQILAVSLDYGMLDPDKERRVVEKVYEDLFGVYGLRSLKVADPRYVGIYEGDEERRNEAYHNGTVWAWLLGPFVRAFLKVNKYENTSKRYAFDNFLKPLFEDEIHRGGLGCIGEIFNGDPPHGSKGCISQAWSVAEPFRAYVEDILLRRPPYEGMFIEKRI